MALRTPAAKVPKEAPSREQVVEDAFTQAEDDLESETPGTREGGAAEEELDDDLGEEGGEGEGGEGEGGEGEGGEGEEQEAGAEGDGERDERGRFKKKPAAGEEGAPIEGEQQLTPEAEAAAALAAQQQAQATSSKLESWRPAERAALLALKGPEGEAVRAAAIRREAQMTAYRQETEQIRGFANDFVRRAEPYRPLFAMLQTTPMQAFDVLMRSAAVLYQGDPRMKAQAVAQMITERGVDPALIADYLDGRTADGQPVPRPDPQFQQLTQQLQQLQSRLDGQQTEAQQVAQEQSDRHVANWAKDKPWFNDVKRRMAVLMQVAEKEGSPLTLDQAYATAISLDPEIVKLERQRRQAAQVKNKKIEAQRHRRAASSPGGSPTVRSKGESTGDRTRDVQNAWDEVEGRIQ